jgi:alcohol dehydrogenase (cytochrome c)
LPLYSGVLATAGNVLFYGTLDRWFKAVDATTGQVLFQKQLECGVAGNPMSYTAPDGKQRVAVYTGTGTLTGGFAGGACPADGNDEDDEKTAAATTTPTSGALHVFKLP